jgi:hypothetical protein
MMPQSNADAIKAKKRALTASLLINIINHFI